MAEYWRQLGIERVRAVVPTISLSMYVAANVHTAAEELADLLEAYVDHVGLACLRSYASNSGAYKKLTKRRVGTDLKHLRSFPTDYVGVRIEYDGGLGGAPGEFGVYIDSDEDDATFPGLTSFVRFDFPLAWGFEDPERIADFVTDAVSAAHVQSAHVGGVLKTTSGSEQAVGASTSIHSLLQRYVGLVPCDRHVRYHMLNQTFTAHWMNYTNKDLLRALGGFTKLKKQLKNCEARKVARGVLVRAALFPPIGDLDQDAPDIGGMPAVARALAPTRFDVGKSLFGKSNAQFDAHQWTRRLDALDVQPWDNG